MKSNELFEEIHCGTIKDGTKINVVNEFTGDVLTTIEYKDGMLKWKTGEFDTSFLCNINIEFLVEENKEIEELNDTNYNCEEMSIEEINYYHNLTRIKLNELVQAVNKLSKEREEK